MFDTILNEVREAFTLFSLALVLLGVGLAAAGCRIREIVKEMREERKDAGGLRR